MQITMLKLLSCFALVLSLYIAICYVLKICSLAVIGDFQKCFYNDADE